MSQRIERQLTITNKLGLHARAATQLAKLALQFDAQITLKQGEKSAPATSVLGLMMLESSQGKQVSLICEGEDAQAASDAISELIERKFDEQD